MPEIVSINQQNLADLRTSSDNVPAMWFVLADQVIHCSDWLYVNQSYTDKKIRGLVPAIPGLSATTFLQSLAARSDVDGSTINFANNEYYTKICELESNNDFIIGKYVSGVSSDIGSEAVEIPLREHRIIALSCSGTAIKGYRTSYEWDDASTPTINITDSAHSSGKFGWARLGTTRAVSTNKNTLVHNINGGSWIMPASSPTLAPVAFFEVPVIGDGRTVPFKAKMPKGKNAVTHSSVIKTERTNGHPREYTAIVRVFDDGKVTGSKLDAIRRIRGVRELDSDFAAIQAAKKLDDLLNDWDFTDYNRKKMGEAAFRKLRNEYLKWKENEQKIKESKYNAEHFLTDNEKGWRVRYA